MMIVVLMVLIGSMRWFSLWLCSRAMAVTLCSMACLRLWFSRWAMVIGGSAWFSLWAVIARTIAGLVFRIVTVADDGLAPAALIARVFCAESIGV